MDCKRPELSSHALFFLQHSYLCLSQDENTTVYAKIKRKCKKIQ